MKEKLDCILLVDDDVIANFLHTRLIKKLNIATSIAVTQNGKEAMQYILNKGAPDMILLDINMPVMDGFEFLEVFFRKCKDKDKTKIIVLSSSLSMRDRSIISSYGIPFLTKPLIGGELLDAL